MSLIMLNSGAQVNSSSVGLVDDGSQTKLPQSINYTQLLWFQVVIKMTWHMLEMIFRNFLVSASKCCKKIKSVDVLWTQKKKALMSRLTYNTEDRWLMLVNTRTVLRARLNVWHSQT